MALISIKRLILSTDGASSIGNTKCPKIKDLKYICCVDSPSTISQMSTTSINVISTASSFSSK
jgi:hypothetical protein